MFHLFRLRGSDASWKDDVECPDDERDFSDDEEERRSRAKRKMDKREMTISIVDEQQQPYGIGFERRGGRGGRGRADEQNSRRGFVHGRGNRGGRRGYAHRGGRDIQQQQSSQFFVSHWPTSTSIGLFSTNQDANSNIQSSFSQYTTMIDRRHMDE